VKAAGIPWPVGMDLLQRGLAWLVSSSLDRTAFADRLDRFRRVSRAWRGLDCSDRTRLQFILRGDAISHRRRMIRSYALIAAITLRMYLPPIFVFHWPFSIGYPLDSQRVNESAQDRRRNFDFFGSGRDSEWRNRLIWGDKKYVLPSLLPEFAGKVKLIYVDLTDAPAAMA
jgi:hypothetical protein